MEFMFWRSDNLFLLQFVLFFVSAFFLIMHFITCFYKLLNFGFRRNGLQHTILTVENQWFFFYNIALRPLGPMILNVVKTSGSTIVKHNFSNFFIEFVFCVFPHLRSDCGNLRFFFIACCFATAANDFERLDFEWFCVSRTHTSECNLFDPK